MVRGPWDKKKRRWITNSAGVDLLELASVACPTLPPDWIVQRVRATEFQNLGMKSLQRACDAVPRLGPTRTRARPAQDPSRSAHRTSAQARPPSRLATLDPSAGALGPLAQWAEQETFNLLVVGSSPTGPTQEVADLGRDRLHPSPPHRWSPKTRHTRDQTYARSDSVGGRPSQRARDSTEPPTRCRRLYSPDRA